MIEPLYEFHNRLSTLQFVPSVESNELSKGIENLEKIKAGAKREDLKRVLEDWNVGIELVWSNPTATETRKKELPTSSLSTEDTLHEICQWLSRIVLSYSNNNNNADAAQPSMQLEGLRAIKNILRWYLQIYPIIQQTNNNSVSKNNESQSAMMEPLLSLEMMTYYTQFVSMDNDDSPNSAPNLFQLQLCRFACLTLFYATFDVPIGPTRSTKTTSNSTSKERIVHLIKQCQLLSKLYPWLATRVRGQNNNSSNVVTTNQQSIVCPSLDELQTWHSIIRLLHNLLVISVTSTTMNFNLKALLLDKKITNETQQLMQEQEKPLSIMDLLLQLLSTCLDLHYEEEEDENDQYQRRRWDVVLETLRVLYVCQISLSQSQCRTFLSWLEKDKSEDDEEKLLLPSSSFDPNEKETETTSAALQQKRECWWTSLNVMTTSPRQEEQNNNDNKKEDDDTDDPPLLLPHVETLCQILDHQLILMEQRRLLMQEIPTRRLLPLLVLLHTHCQDSLQVSQAFYHTIFPQLISSTKLQEAQRKLPMKPLVSTPCLQTRLIACMTSTLQVPLKRWSSEFIWILCGQNVQVYCIRAGYGNAVALLQQKGLV